jgi:hypothetical protein
MQVCEWIESIRQHGSELHSYGARRIVSESERRRLLTPEKSPWSSLDTSDDERPAQYSALESQS